MNAPNTVSRPTSRPSTSSRSKHVIASCALSALALFALLWTGASRVSAQEVAGKKVAFAGTKPGEEWSGNGLKMKFCWCPSGRFTMGSPASEPDREKDEDQVSVTLTRGFWLGKHEVTQGEWERIMRATLAEQRDKADPKYSLYGEGANYPMYYVNHDEATEFCRKLTDQERKAARLPADWEYRLPTEAQWEYACRAGTKTATAFGDKLGSDQANFDGNSPYNGADKGEYLKRTAIVGSYKANAWGLHDMHGNVWEWCRDWYKETLPGGTDPDVTEKASYRVLRGGCWSDEGGLCRSALRRRNTPDDRHLYIGFRLAAVQSSK
jgi:sulfatase modifying factor 1